MIPKKLKLKSTITWFGDENDPDKITNQAEEVIKEMVTNNRKSISHLADGAFRKFNHQILVSISFHISTTTKNAFLILILKFFYAKFNL